ncbi:uncharacterized protein LOC129308335 [Prosopis cineraria]|uniref:uncharacterized protein LOC129308335 n=1 Tax=Prosopis cineraria TaxID=364024 RepID=UPI00240FBFD9|nr:uncharacterized protein LOC129308335 [Prosopis cineraria]
MAASASKHLNLSSSSYSSSSKPPKISIDESKPASISIPNPTVSSSPFTISHENLSLSRASYLTRHELLKRRFHYLSQLSKCYRDLYWALMEDLKTQYREYSWEYGLSPFREGNMQERERGNFEGNGENNDCNGSNSRAVLDVVNNQRCAFVGCKLKAMPLTSFCHLHILSDCKQKLYKACNYVIKSAQAGPITCGKPILRSTTPSLCNVHFQKAQKHLTRTLKKAGLNNSLACKQAPKFHVIVAEYVRQIQMRRRQLTSNRRIIVKEEKDK